MSDKAENHTVKLLQEMRQEMRERFDKVDERFSKLDVRFDDVDTRIDGLTHIITLMAGHSYNLDARVERLEGGTISD